MKTLSPSLSRREKLLLGLLTSTLVFSASFSYGAVSQSKVDSIMETIDAAARGFSAQVDKDTYYQRVYTGLSDAIEMLGVVRNTVGNRIGTAPVDIPPVVNPPSSPNPTNPPTSAAPLGTFWKEESKAVCPLTLSQLKFLNPDTIDTQKWDPKSENFNTYNPTGYHYVLFQTGSKTLYNPENYASWNVKDYAKPSDESLPNTCHTGKRFIKHDTGNMCTYYSCVTPPGKPEKNPPCADDNTTSLFDFDVNMRLPYLGNGLPPGYGFALFTDQNIKNPQIFSVKIDMTKGPGYWKTAGASYDAANHIMLNSARSGNQSVTLSPCRGDMSSAAAIPIRPNSQVGIYVDGEHGGPSNESPTSGNGQMTINITSGRIWYLNIQAQKVPGYLRYEDSPGFEETVGSYVEIKAACGYAEPTWCPGVVPSPERTVSSRLDLKDGVMATCHGNQEAIFGSCKAVYSWIDGVAATPPSWIKDMKTKTWLPPLQ